MIQTFTNVPTDANGAVDVANNVLADKVPVTDRFLNTPVVNLQV